MNSIKEYSFFVNLAKLPFIEEIWLFGSRVRGDNRERSDIDIAILCPNASKDDWQQVLEIIYDAYTFKNRLCTI